MKGEFYPQRLHSLFSPDVLSCVKGAWVVRNVCLFSFGRSKHHPARSVFLCVCVASMSHKKKKKEKDIQAALLCVLFSASLPTHQMLASYQKSLASQLNSCDPRPEFLLQMILEFMQSRGSSGTGRPDSAVVCLSKTTRKQRNAVSVLCDGSNTSAPQGNLAHKTNFLFFVCLSPL